MRWSARCQQARSMQATLKICWISSALSRKHQEIFYLWRPHLRDPGDDLVLEVAFAAGADYLVTFNLKDFVEAKSVGVKVITPQQMLLKIGR